MKNNRVKFVASVLDHVIDGRYTKSKACLKTGYSRPYLYELLYKYKKDGIVSLAHKNLDKTPVNKTDEDRSKRIIELYRSKYDGFNYSHF